jgi:PPOX class probable F420-dependent enzyme
MGKRIILDLIVLCTFVSTCIYWSNAGAADNKRVSPAQATAAAMNKEELQAFLAQPLIARLALVRANGTAQVLPMWFLYEGGVMYMSTRPERAKVKHLKANPRVAVVVDVMEAPLKNKVVTLEGTVEIQTTGVKEMTTKIYRKYMGDKGVITPAAQQNIDAPRVILKITPMKIESVDTTR